MYLAIQAWLSHYRRWKNSIYLWFICHLLLTTLYMIRIPIKNQFILSRDKPLKTLELFEPVFQSLNELEHFYKVEILNYVLMVYKPCSYLPRPTWKWTFIRCFINIFSSWWWSVFWVTFRENMRLVWYENMVPPAVVSL